MRAVLFWADGCDACHSVINDILPPLQDEYGSGLEILFIQVSETLNYDYFRGIEDERQLAPERRGVPALFIADQLLVGDAEIGRELPGYVRKYLAAGGVDYPALPDLPAYLAQSGGEKSSCSDGSLCAGASAAVPLTDSDLQLLSRGTTTAADEITSDASSGMSLATGVMIALVLALAYSLVSIVLVVLERGVPALPEAWDLGIPILAVIGLGVAGYLSFVETQNVAAVCGPVGDCNTVQTSAYAKLFGVLPVGVLGLGGYVAMLASWLAARFGRGRIAEFAPLALTGMALFGVLFTIYLTYLELFVIRAVCLWCLGSAVIMGLILVLSVGQAVRAITRPEDEPLESAEA